MTNSGVYYDAEYVPQISYRLERFKQKDRLKWNFRCPICGDSKKSSIKARGFIIEGANGLWFNCYNCGRRHSFSSFLKILDPSLFMAYRRGKYYIGPKRSVVLLEDFSVDPQKAKSFSSRSKKTSSDFLVPIKSLSSSHPAVLYLLERKIPKRFWSEMYFTNDFDRAFGRSMRREPRIVFPCNKFNGEPFAYQARILPSVRGIRYKIMKLNESLPMAFGLNRMDFSKVLYVVEGPFDSFFLSNSIAICSANLISISNVFHEHNIPILPPIVLVYDNERRNPDIIRRMSKAISFGFNVCVWPDWVKPKDINLMAIGGLDPQKIISENTYHGLRARHHLQKWMRCSMEDGPSIKLTP